MNSGFRDPIPSMPDECLAKLDAWQADAIRNAKSDRVRRRYACALVRWAMHEFMAHDEEIENALGVAERLADGNVDEQERRNVRNIMIAISQQLDCLYSQEMSKDEEVDGDNPDASVGDHYHLATAAIFCLNRSSWLGAANATYEVGSATRVENITEQEIERKQREIARILQED